MKVASQSTQCMLAVHGAIVDVCLPTIKHILSLQWNCDESQGIQHFAYCGLAAWQWLPLQLLSRIIF